MRRTTEVLSVRTGRVGLWAVVRIAGELDVAGLPALARGVEDACHAGTPPRLVLDLADVTFIDSSGLGGIIRAWQRVTAEDGRFVLVGMRDRVQKVFRITRLAGVFETYDTMDDFSEAPG